MLNHILLLPSKIGMQSVVPLAVGGLFEDIGSFLTDASETFIEMFSSGIMKIISLDFGAPVGENYLTTYFTFLKEVYFIAQIIGFSLLFMIVVFQLFKGLTGGLAEAENPWVLLIRSLFFAGCIAIAGNLMMIIYKPGSILIEKTKELYEESDVPFAISRLYKGNLGAMLKDMAGNLIARFVLSLIMLVFNIVIFINYIKLALECLERWVILGVLFYTSPIIFSLGASKATVNVFKAWIRMVLSTMVLLVLDMAIVYVYLQAAKQASNGMNMHAWDGLSAFSEVMIWSWVLLAVLRVGQRLDVYVGSLGLNTAQAGANLGMEFMGAMSRLGTQAANLGQRAYFNAQRSKTDAKRATDAMHAQYAKVGRDKNGAQQVKDIGGQKVSSKDVKSAVTGEGVGLKGVGLDNEIANQIRKGNENMPQDKKFLGDDDRIMNSVATEKGLSFDVQHGEGGPLEHMELSSTPQSADATPVDLDGSTYWATASPYARGDTVDAINNDDFYNKFTPPQNAEGTMVDSDGRMYNSTDTDTQREFGSSYMARMVDEHGAVTNQAVADPSGNIAFQHEDGTVSVLSPASTTMVGSSESFSAVCDGSGSVPYYARNYSQPIASYMGANLSDIESGSIREMPQEMRERVSSYLNTDPDNITRGAVISNNGYSMSVQTLGEDGRKITHTIANSDAFETPAHLNQPDSAYKSAPEVKDGPSAYVYSSGSSKQAETAFVPLAQNDALSAEYARRNLEQQQKRAEYDARTTSFTDSPNADATHQYDYRPEDNAPISMPTAYGPTSYMGGKYNTPTLGQNYTYEQGTNSRDTRVDENNPDDPHLGKNVITNKNKEERFEAPHKEYRRDTQQQKNDNKRNGE